MTHHLLLNLAGLTHQQRPAQIAVTLCRNLLRKLTWNCESFLPTCQLKDLADLGQTASHNEHAIALDPKLNSFGN